MKRSRTRSRAWGPLGLGIPPGFPDNFNTGPSGTLTAVPASATSGTGWFWDALGFIRVTSDSVTISGLDIAGGVLCDGHTGVTLSNIACRGITLTVGSHNGSILNCTVQGNGINDYTGINVGSGGPCNNVAIERCNVYGWENAIIFSGTGGRIAHNYLHNPIPYTNPPDPHIDGIECVSTATNGLVIFHNTILMPNASSGITCDSTSMTIDSNYMLGGAYVVRFKYDDSNALINNLLGDGFFGYFTNEGGGTGTPDIHGNVDAFTGAPIVYNPAVGLTHAQAKAVSIGMLRNWFALNTGPRIPVTTIFNGDYNVNSQADADALSGVTVRGRLFINVGNVTAVDFAVEWDGSGTGKNLLQSTGGVSNVTLQYFRLDGKYGNISYGITGTSFSDSWTVTNGDIKRMGGDGIRFFVNSTYNDNYVHDFRPWYAPDDGPWVPNGDQNLYPHTDAGQAVR